MGAFLSGAVELYGLAVACLVLVTVAWVRLRTVSWNVSVTRTVVPTRFSSGASSRVELVARNSASKPSPEAEGRDPLGSSGRAARFNIASMQPGEERRTTYQLPPLRRGVYQLGPLSVLVGDPFGLAELEQRSAGEATLVVHPRFEVLPYTSLHSGSRPSFGHVRLAGGPDPDSFLLRRYVAGDDLRRVHWPTTARVGELTLRQDEPRGNDLVVVVADLRMDKSETARSAVDDAFEAVLESAATICSVWIRSGSEVRLLTSAGYDSGPGCGPGHFTAILDGLAASEPHAPGGPPVRLGFSAGCIPITIVTTDRCTPSLLGDLTGRQPAQSDTVVVIATVGEGFDETANGRHSPDDGDPGLLANLANVHRSLYVPVGSTLGRQMARGDGAR